MKRRTEDGKKLQIQSWQACSILHLNTLQKGFGSVLSESKERSVTGFILFVGIMFCKYECPKYLTSLSTTNGRGLCETAQLGEAEGITVSNSSKLVLFSQGGE